MEYDEGVIGVPGCRLPLTSDPPTRFGKVIDGPDYGSSGPRLHAAVSPKLRPHPAETNPPVRESKVTVKIPRPLFRRIQQVVEGSGFNSPTDFIVYVLRDLMGKAESEAHGDVPEFNQQELEDVKRKLKNLGYL